MRTASSHVNARSAPGRGLADAVDTLVGRIDALAREVASLQTSVSSLRGERRGDGAAPSAGRRAAGRATATRAAAPRGTTAGAARRSNSPVTRSAVTSAIARLGSPTAAEIAAALSRRGLRVSGRAVRWVAEAAGATVSVGADGKRRYSL